MPTSPDGVYDHSSNWRSTEDRVAYQRAFSEGSGEQRKIALALLTANPETPEADITANLTVAGVPPRFGYQDTPVVIEDMFSRNLGHVNDFAPTNFSGQQGSYSGTSGPALPMW